MFESVQEEAQERTVHLRWTQLTKTEDGFGGNQTGTAALVGDRVYWASPRGLLALLSVQTWTWKIANTFLPRLGRSHCAQLAEDKIYYFGGRGSTTLVVYDTVLDTPSEVMLNTIDEQTLQRTEGSAVFASWRNEIITFGGYCVTNNLRGYDSETCALSVESKVWKRIYMRGRPPGGRIGHSATLCGTKMYIFGGKAPFGDYLDRIWIAELGFHCLPFWSTPDIYNPVSRKLHALNSINGYIILYGGYNAIDWKDLHIFFPETKQWRDQRYDSQVVIFGDAPEDAGAQLGLTVPNGVLYFTGTGVYRLSPHRLNT